MQNYYRCVDTELNQVYVLTKPILDTLISYMDNFMKNV